MSAEFVIVQSHPAHGPDLLGDLLASRARPVRLVARHDGAALPPFEAVRALVVLGGVAADDEVRALAARCAAEGVPVLATGLGASALADGVTAVPPAVTSVSPAEGADGDEVFEALEPDTGMVGGARLEAPAGALVLARSDDGPAAVRVGEAAYALAFAPEHDAAWLVAQLGGEADEDTVAALTRRNRVLRPHSIALLGRWVDGVVGRTEDEAPWGRRGPAPEARPGLYLNPA